jgi:hypothetical protein
MDGRRVADGQASATVTLANTAGCKWNTRLRLCRTSATYIRQPNRISRIIDISANTMLSSALPPKIKALAFVRMIFAKVAFKGNPDSHRR